MSSCRKRTQETQLQFQCPIIRKYVWELCCPLSGSQVYREQSSNKRVFLNVEMSLVKWH